MDSPRMEQESSSTLTNPMQGAGGGGGPAADAQQAKRPHLSIDIPAPSTSSVLLTPTAAEADTVPTTPPGSNASRTPGSASGSGKNGAPGKPPAPQRTPSFKLRQTVRSLLPGGGSFKSSVRGYEASLSRLFSGRIARTSSLPVVDDVLSASVHGVDKTLPTATAAADKTGIHRSQSLPMNMKKFNSAKSIKRMNSLGGVYRVVPSTPRVPAATAATSNAVPDIVPTEPGAGEEGDEDHGENIAEEEAVCRICMVELSEGGGAMKLECACKGELALAHTDCALKWFGIKGTRTCEVCKQEVQNLPVTLMRLQSARGGEPGRTGANGPRYVRYRLCHGTPILVIISILAYFCFLEQLLVAHNGFAALAISLPFSCILGLFSSLTTTSMVARRYVWIYAAVQFLFVVFFTHLFYRYLHLQAVISIILATFAGFGVGMIGNSIIIEVLRWRAMTPAQSRRARRPPRVPQQQQALASGQPSDQPSAPVEEQRNTAVDVENPAIPQA